MSQRARVVMDTGNRLSTYRTKSRKGGSIASFFSCLHLTDSFSLIRLPRVGDRGASLVRTLERPTSLQVFRTPSRKPGSQGRRPVAAGRFGLCHLARPFRAQQGTTALSQSNRPSPSVGSRGRP